MTPLEYRRFREAFIRFIVKKPLVEVRVFKFILAQFFELEERQRLDLINDMALVEYSKTKMVEIQTNEEFIRMMEKEFPNQ